jgi:transposase-like protein
MNPETLREWLRRAEFDAADAEGTPPAAGREIRELKRRNAELERAPLEQTVEILKAATRPRRASSCGTATRDSGDLCVHRRAPLSSGSLRSAGC